MDKSKVEAIRDVPKPTTKKQFLGLVGFYCKCVPNLSSIAVPLTDLTKKGQPNKVHWYDCHERAFNTLRVRCVLFQFSSCQISVRRFSYRQMLRILV